MSSSGPSVWKCYLNTRLILGFFDFATDCAQAISLLSLNHPFWAFFTLFFPFMAAILAAMSVIVAKCKTKVPMSFLKFLCLSAKALTSLFEGLFESGPELILQTIIVFHGIHLEDIVILTSPQHLWTWPWFRGILHIFSIVASFFSLLITVLYFNQDRINRKGYSDSMRFVIALATDLFSILLRGFMASVMVLVAPVISLSLILFFFFLNFAIFFWIGMDGGTAALSAYAGLFVPSGYAKDQGSAAQTHPHVKPHRRRYSAGSLGRTTATRGLHDSFSEVERAKINQEGLYDTVKITHCLFGAQSLCLIIPYVVLLEVYHFPTPTRIIPQLGNRVVLYTIPLLLVIISCLLVFCFVIRIKRARDAARHWFSITPHRNRVGNSNSIRVAFQRERSASVEPPSHSEASTALVTDTLPIQPSAPPKTNLDTSQPPPYSPVCPNEASTGHFQPGNNKCGKTTCITCELLVDGPNFRSMMSGKEYKFMPEVNCETKSVVYLVTCSTCKKQYVGKTEQPLKQRHYGHRREIELQSTPLGKHFAGSCGYPKSWRFQIIDHTSESGHVLKRREGYWQHELMTFHPWGLNVRNELNGNAK